MFGSIDRVEAALAFKTIETGEKKGSICIFNSKGVTSKKSKNSGYGFLQGFLSEVIAVFALGEAQREKW